tara:strand:- start:146 stop:343 length:198 start_codon:yes stop_codon:yes gene_type:complete
MTYEYHAMRITDCTRALNTELKAGWEPHQASVVDGDNETVGSVIYILKKKKEGEEGSSKMGFEHV